MRVEDFGGPDVVSIPLRKFRKKAVRVGLEEELASFHPSKEV